MAHRGGSALSPENTLPAIREARRLEVDGIEIDVRRGKGGEILVIHDATLDRTTSMRGRVSDYSRFNLRVHRTHIPTLREALRVAQPVPLMVEMKEAEMAIDVAEEVVKAKACDRACLMSFLTGGLRTAKRHFPEVIVGHLVKLSWRGQWPGVIRRTLDQALAIDARFICVDAGGCSKLLADGAHRLGLPVWVWTVDRLETADRLAAMGVDGLISNDPEKIQAWSGVWQWTNATRKVR